MSEFGQSIKRWRKSRGFSQLDLSLHADISSKHISFLENGRAQPSKGMIIHLSNILEVPLSERVLLFAAAGFSDTYSQMSLNQPEMSSVKQALELLLDNHAPFPAMVFDCDWNIVLANEPQKRLTMLLMQKQPNFPSSNNVMELLFDPNGFRPFINNWAEVAYSLLQRLQRERMMHQDRPSDLIERLLAYPDIPSDWHTQATSMNIQPMIPIDIILGDVRLKLFSTLASFGTAIDVTMQDLMIEQYFPSDAVTKSFFEDLKKANP